MRRELKRLGRTVDKLTEMSQTSQPTDALKDKQTSQP
jgi:hypothetical protein